MSEPVTQPLRIGAERIVTTESSLVRNPFDKSIVGAVSVGTVDHIDEAVAIAHQTFHAGSLPAWRRAEILDTAARLLSERQEEFAQRITAESAKPIATARVEVARAVDTFRFSAVQARTLTGETIPLDASSAGEKKLGFVLRVPLGVVGAISPFNFPVNLVVHKIGPAIAAGCSVVLKPASSTPLSALALVDLLVDDCGLPPGWLNIVTCSGSVANRLVEHPDVAMISFTGSPEVGWGLRAAAPKKKVGLELGNNAPVIVAADSNWQGAAKKITIAGTSFAGQSCISVQRVYVEQSIYENFLAELSQNFSQLIVGSPFADDVQVSSLITPAETQRVQTWINDAVAQGARIVAGGTTNDDGVLLPTVLADVLPHMEICRTEVFGPVIGVQPYSELSEAIAYANDTRYGLQASIFTTDVSSALRATYELDFGGVLVNEVPTWRADHMPYGGVRDSGNTREGPAYAVQEMTERRVVIFSYE